MIPGNLKMIPGGGQRQIIVLAASLYFVCLLSPGGRGQEVADLSAFMKVLSVDYVTRISGKDEALKEVLFKTFEADWSKAKECLLFGKWPVPSPKPPHDAGLALMEELVKMRTRMCKQVEDATKADLPGYLGKPVTLVLMPPELRGAFTTEVTKHSPEANFKMLAPSGAEKRTSDIDVASNGYNTEIGVRVFNETFRQQMGVAWDPATVFDYNVYAADWIFPDNFLKGESNGVTEITPRSEHILASDAGASPSVDIELQTARSEIFERAALLHIRRNCTEREWNAYLGHRGPEGAPILTKLQVVNDQFNSFNAEIRLKMNDIRKAIPKPASAWPDDYYEEAIETRARNEIYQNRLLKVKELRLNYRMLKDKSVKTEGDRKQMFTLAIQITQALTDAIFFANEVYATEGATLHATQGIQKVAKARKEGKTVRVNLTDAHYLQSFHENVGDALHSLNHYRGDPPYAAYRAGKYIERMLLAGKALPGEAPSALGKHPLFDSLNKLGDKAAVVKDSPAGDDPAQIEVKFQEFESVATQESLRSAVLTIGGFVPGQVTH